MKGIIRLILLFIFLAGCKPITSQPTLASTSTVLPDVQDLSADEIATLSSIEKLDDYPLYSMRYVGDYTHFFIANSDRHPEPFIRFAPNTCQPAWGCALFAALGDPASRQYGRNFDWRFSPALLLSTDPPDGYASVSMVDIDYLSFRDSLARNLLDLPLSERRALLYAPFLPFDGMNEQGVAIGMAAVPPGEMQADPAKKTIDHLTVMREILDHAGTVDDAVGILESYNIDMGSVPLHYLIASAAGESALVEFYQGKMEVLRDEDPWQLATNFLVASTAGQPQGQCPRYDRISQKLRETDGKLTSQAALDLLADVSQNPPQAQSPTQWSIVYELTSGEIHVVMGRAYDIGAHTLQLNLAGK